RGPAFERARRHSRTTGRLAQGDALFARHGFEASTPRPEKPSGAALAAPLGSSSLQGPRELSRYLPLFVSLENRLPALSGADANRLLNRDDEDLAVADLARAGVLEDRLDDERLVFVLDHHLELQLRPDVDRQGRASVLLDDSLLAAGALGLDDREGREPLLEQLGPDRLERLVADERLYLL